MRAKEPDAQIWDGGWSEGSVGLDHLLRPGSQFLYLANRVDFTFARGGLAMVWEASGAEKGPGKPEERFTKLTGKPWQAARMPG